LLEATGKEQEKALYASLPPLIEAFGNALTPMFLSRALNYAQLDFTRRGLRWERSTVFVRHLQILAGNTEN
jgi:hypothetical protein